MKNIIDIAGVSYERADQHVQRFTAPVAFRITRRGG
jgi:hypothetical protein